MASIAYDRSQVITIDFVFLLMWLLFANFSLCRISQQQKKIIEVWIIQRILLMISNVSKLRWEGN